MFLLECVHSTSFANYELFKKVKWWEYKNYIFAYMPASERE